MIKTNEIIFALPLIIITLAAIISMFFRLKTSKTTLILLTINVVFLLTVSYFYAGFINKDILFFNEFLKINTLSISFSLLSIFSVLFTLIASKSYIEKLEINFAEYYSLVLFSLLGMLLMLTANDLLIVFLGLELMSICFYVLAGFLRKRIKSNESALKYFLLGAFMTGFLIYGISLIYGASGTTNLTRIISNPSIFHQPVFLIGVALFLIGFLFKMGIFPFHMWVPDVYDGAPTVISGMMSTAGKVAAVGTITPFLLNINVVEFKVLIAVLAVLSMLLGNIIALSQTNIKRLLAYSSIASAGYIMVGIASLDDFALKGISFYLMAYTFMQLGAFILVSILEINSNDISDFINISIADYKGLAKKNPLFAVFLTIFLFSLGGIPPFAGFWGKYYLFYAAIKSNLIWLSVIAIILSIISIYYYLRIIVNMWFYDYSDNLPLEKIKFNPLGKLAVVVCILGTLLFGVYPDLFFYIFKYVVK